MQAIPSKNPSISRLFLTGLLGGLGDLLLAGGLLNLCKTVSIILDIREFK